MIRVRCRMIGAYWRFRVAAHVRGDVTDSTVDHLRHLTTTMSDDFLARESELLGDDFSIPTNTGGSFATATGGEEIDFDAAASAFPDISLDGDFPSLPETAAPPAAGSALSGGFSFDDFEPPRERTTEVKVTGDDEIDKFESEFPEIDVPSVSLGCVLLAITLVLQ